ncbi:MAG: hypothetical protein ACT4QC_14815 [Planctomycetaceae bacterium]
MPSVAPEVELRDALTAFETCLETPLVPGEFERWLADARAALDRIDERLPVHVVKNHRTQLKQIAEADKEMFARIGALARDDEKSLEQLAWFKEWGARLAERTSQTEPDEKKLDDEFAEFSKQGLEFVIDVRKQELAFSTWLGEALNRDRGGEGD